MIISVYYCGLLCRFSANIYFVAILRFEDKSYNLWNKNHLYHKNHHVDVTLFQATPEQQSNLCVLQEHTLHTPLHNWTHDVNYDSLVDWIHSRCSEGRNIKNFRQRIGSSRLFNCNRFICGHHLAFIPWIIFYLSRVLPFLYVVWGGDHVRSSHPDSSVAICLCNRHHDSWNLDGFGFL